jgi:hypothetical protein
MQYTLLSMGACDTSGFILQHRITPDGPIDTIVLHTYIYPSFFLMYFFLFLLQLASRLHNNREASTRRGERRAIETERVCVTRFPQWNSSIRDRHRDLIGTVKISCKITHTRESEWHLVRFFFKIR